MPRWSGSARSWPDADGLRWNALTIQQPHRLISIARDPARIVPSPPRHAPDKPERPGAGRPPLNDPQRDCCR